MHLNPIADLEQVQKNDPRITKVGKFIRKTSIDELPQFFNVFILTRSLLLSLLVKKMIFYQGFIRYCFIGF